MLKINCITIVIILLLLFSSFFLYGSERKERENIQQYIREGKNLYQENDYLGAVEKWMKVLEIDPWNNEVKNMIERALKDVEKITKKLNEGFTLLENGNIDEAYKTFTYVKNNSNPGDLSICNPLDKGFKRIEEIKNIEQYYKIIKEGDEYLNSENYKSASFMYNYAKKYYPKGKEADLRLSLLKERIEEEKRINTIKKIKDIAKELFEDGIFDKAKEKWNEVLKLKPDDEESRIYLSKIEFKEKEKERLFALAKGYFENGVSLYKDKKYEESIDQFENAVAMNYQIEAARSYITDIKDAIEKQKRLEMEKKAKLVANYLRNGIKYYNLKKFKESLYYLNEGLRIEKENTQIKEYIIRDVIALKREEEKIVPVTSPFYKLVQNLKRLGIDEFKKENYNESIKYWEEILLIFPFNEEARLYFTKALSKVDPELVEDILTTNYNEAKELLGRNKKREALAKLELIVEVNSKFMDAQKKIKEIEAESKKNKIVIPKALNCIKKKILKVQLKNGIMP